MLLFLLPIRFPGYFSNFYEEDLTIYLLSLSNILLINGLNSITFNKETKSGNFEAVIMIELII